MWDTRIISDRKIQEAQEEGLFDNLPGAGKPLDLDDDLHVPPHLRAGHRILKNANVPPEWIQLDAELTRSRDECAGMWQETERIWKRNPSGGSAWLARRRTAYHSALKQFNTDVLKFNMIAPAIGRVHIPFRIDEEMARFDSAFPRLSDSPSTAGESEDSRLHKLRSAAAERYRAFKDR